VLQGKIPRNAYGNIDMFTPTMLPPGAVHLPCTSFSEQVLSPHTDPLSFWDSSVRRQGDCKSRQKARAQLRRGRRQCDIASFSHPNSRPDPILVASQTGFEYKKQRAIPVVTGVVVAEENKDALMEAYEIATADAEERALIKKKAAVIKRWQKLITDLRIRKKLQIEYGNAAVSAPVVNLSGRRSS
jgi:xeroderma pigmentosum group C-complementing protein